MTVRRRRIGGAVGFDERSFRHSQQFSDDLLEEAIEVFQERTERTLTLEDARQMLENLTGFFGVLREWERAQVRQEEEIDVEGIEFSAG